MKPNRLRRLLIAFCCSTVIVPAVQATGADAAEGQNEEIGSKLEEITVTARKREETLLSVPVVANVVSGQTLEKQQFDDVYNLQDYVPGLLLGTGVGAFSTNVSIRGVGTEAVDATIDQDVSINLDGLQLSQALAYRATLFDLNQVEVLKGPQALFFGKNSPAGVISIRSADPTDKTDIILRSGYETDAQEKFGEVIFSGPLGPTVKARLALHYSDNNGYLENNSSGYPSGFGMIAPPTNTFGDDENAMVRATILFDPSDKYSARLKVNYFYDFLNHGGTDLQTASCPFGKTSFTGLPVFDPAMTCQLGRATTEQYFDPKYWQGAQNNGIPFVREHQAFGTLEQNLHLGDFALTSVTGYYWVNQPSLSNGSATSGFSTLAANNDFSDREITEEMRVNTNFTNSPMNYMVGIFYQNGSQTNHVDVLGNTGIPGVPLPPVLQGAYHIVDIYSFSGFGQAIWKVTDKIELTGGVRVTHETRNHTETDLSPPVGLVALVDPNISSTNASPEATLTYRPTDDLTAYASYKTGFKSGSFDTLVLVLPPTQSSFGDESVKGGEVGLKSLLLEHHLRVNAAIYYYRYSDLQVGTNEITPSGVIEDRTLNAASAITQGVDFDATYAPPRVAGLTLKTAINYNHAYYASFPNAPCDNGQLIAEGCNQLFADGSFHAQDLTGRPLARAPTWSINGGLDYETRVGDDMTLGLGTSVAWTERFYRNVTDTPIFLFPAYTKVNANIALKGPNDKWELALIGNNLSDKFVAGTCAGTPEQSAIIFGGYYTGTNVRGPAGGDYPICYPERGREVWLRITFRPLALLR